MSADTPDEQERMARLSDETVRVAEDVWTEDEPTLAEYELVERVLSVARVAAERERADAAVEQSFDHAYDYGFDDSEWGEGYRHRDKQVRRALRAALGDTESDR